jgi:hypothetical protein
MGHRIENRSWKRSNEIAHARTHTYLLSLVNSQAGAGHTKLEKKHQEQNDHVLREEQSRNQTNIQRLHTQTERIHFYY